MNGKNNDETSTFEQETKNNFELILKAITEMRQDFNDRSDKIEARLDKIETAQKGLEKEFHEFKNYVEIQFEAVRQGIVKNYNQFDRIESQISENRSVIFSTKAAVGELSERVYLLNKAGEQALKQ